MLSNLKPKPPRTDRNSSSIGFFLLGRNPFNQFPGLNPMLAVCFFSQRVMMVDGIEGACTARLRHLLRDDQRAGNNASFPWPDSNPIPNRASIPLNNSVAAATGASLSNPYGISSTSSASTTRMDSSIDEKSSRRWPRATMPL
ncbi:high-affinity nickel permease [Striga asiatica]|uniref:High-affinity nickel permease n=1 Tax=Striga asiatica TaxID=4170 RepID=A0A5A7Q5C0_STRAF|nr:high-affinity nickel permease [Striga asiatica]